MYIYIYVYMYIYMFIYIYIHMYMYTCIYISMCKYQCLLQDVLIQKPYIEHNFGSILTTHEEPTMLCELFESIQHSYSQAHTQVHLNLVDCL